MVFCHLNHCQERKMPVGKKYTRIIECLQICKPIDRLIVLWPSWCWNHMLHTTVTKSADNPHLLLKTLSRASPLFWQWCLVSELGHRCPRVRIFATFLSTKYIKWNVQLGLQGSMATRLTISTTKRTVTMSQLSSFSPVTPEEVKRLIQFATVYELCGANLAI